MNPGVVWGLGVTQHTDYWSRYSDRKKIGEVEKKESSLRGKKRTEAITPTPFICIIIVIIIIIIHSFIIFITERQFFV